MTPRLQMLALVNGRLALPDEIVTGRTLVVAGDRIEAVTADDDPGSDIERLDLEGRLVTPGLIDLHQHGMLGRSFDEPVAEAWDTIATENARHGITTVVATLAAAPLTDLIGALAFARSWLDTPSEGARIAGVHLEGPYLNPVQAGAMEPRHLRQPDDGTAGELLAFAEIIRIMTLAPELPGALTLIERLSEIGIVPSAGHSDARDDEVEAAVGVGLSHVTHLWSGQSTTIREGPWRRPGLLEAALVSDTLTAEMIADNRHLPPTLMKMGIRCLGPDRLCLVSDAVSGAGLPEGSRYRVAGTEYEVHDGVGMMPDRSCFAGSTTPLNQMIDIVIREVGLAPVEAVRMATLTPARVIGEAGSRGALEAGKLADLAVFNDDFSAWGTMIGGRWIHREGETA